MKLHFFLSTNSEGGFISRKQDDGGRILTRAAKLTAAGQKTSAVLCSGGVSLCNNDGVFALNLAGCGRLNIFFAFAGFFVKRIPVFKRCFGIGMQRFFEIFADVCVFFQKTGKINGCGFFAAVGFDERQVEAVTFFQPAHIFGIVFFSRVKRQGFFPDSIRKRFVKPFFCHSAMCLFIVVLKSFLPPVAHAVDNQRQFFFGGNFGNIWFDSAVFKCLNIKAVTVSERTKIFGLQIFLSHFEQFGNLGGYFVVNADFGKLQQADAEVLDAFGVVHFVCAFVNGAGFDSAFAVVYRGSSFFFPVGLPVHAGRIDDKIITRHLKLKCLTLKIKNFKFASNLREDF